MGQWAALYASQGLHIIPVNPATKKPIIAEWQKKASCDAATVAGWWQAWPNASIGWVLGRDGLAAVDCDNKDTEAGGRHEVEAWLTGRGEDLPATLTSVTGSGGHHLIFRLPEDVTMGNRTRVLPDVDIKSADGQIVLPPSVHKTGNLYAWAEGVDYNHLLSAITVMPQSLVNLIGSGKNGDGGKSSITGIDSMDLLMNGVPEGQRDDAIFGLAVRELKGGSSPTAVLALVREVARASDFPQDEAEAKFQQAMKFVITNPPDVLPDWHPERSTGEAVQGASDDDSGRDDLLDGMDTRDLNLLQDMQRRRRVSAVDREIAARSSFVVPQSTLDLTEELSIEDGPVSWTIENLHQQGFNSTITAMYKTGKTTLLMNLLRSLVDGEPFLGSLGVRPLSGRVALLNYELSDRQAREWARRQSIQNLKGASLLNLRGRQLDLLSDVGRDFMIKWLREREVEVIIVDPFARAFGGKINDNDEVTRWTDNMDVIKHEAGVEDLFLTAHMPRSGEERAIGAVRFDGWADSIWKMTKQSGTRYLSAEEGRDVDFKETALSFDEATGHLTLGEIGRGRSTDRAEVKAADLLPSILGALSQLGDGTNTRAIREVVTGSTADVGAAIKAAVEQGFVTIAKGDKNANLHTLTEAGRQRIASAVDNIWTPGVI